MITQQELDTFSGMLKAARTDPVRYSSLCEVGFRLLDELNTLHVGLSNLLNEMNLYIAEKERRNFHAEAATTFFWKNQLEKVKEG